jgi:hypothetical protein
MRIACLLGLDIPLRWALSIRITSKRRLPYRRGGRPCNKIIQFVGHYILRPLPMRAPPPDRSGICLTHSSLFRSQLASEAYVFLTIDFLRTRGVWQVLSPPGSQTMRQIKVSLAHSLIVVR